MASTPVEARVGIDGLTGLKLKLYARGSDTLANSVGGDTLTEQTNRVGTYRATVTEALAGTYEAYVLNGDGDVIYTGVVDLVDDTSVYTIGEWVQGVTATVDIGAADAAQIAAATWANSTRTLTQTAAEIASVLSGDDLTIHRGDTLTISFTSLGSVAARSKLWFSVKSSASDADANAQINVLVTNPANATTDGLQYIAGTTATTKANASITVNDEDDGDITVVVKAVEVAKLSAPMDDWVYDMQMLDTSGNISTLTSGTAVMAADVSRATS